MKNRRQPACWIRALGALTLAIATPLILANQADPFARARADIGRYCKNKNPSCEADQKDQLGHFATMMAGFRDPSHSNAKTCMSRGKVGQYVDWTIAADCMRNTVKGRKLGR